MKERLIITVLCIALIVAGFLGGMEYTKHNIKFALNGEKLPPCEKRDIGDGLSFVVPEKACIGIIKIHVTKEE